MLSICPTALSPRFRNRAGVGARSRSRRVRMLITAHLYLFCSVPENSKQRIRMLRKPHKHKHTMTVEPEWDQHERSSAQQLEDERENELNPKRTCTHRIFVFIKGLAILAAIAMASGQFVGIAFHQVSPVQYVLRVYMIGFCIVMTLAEMEWPKFIYENSLLSNWISRGIMYSFIGTIGISQNTVQGVTGAPKAALMYIEVAAWGMVGIGVLYFFLGIFCCQLVFNHVRRDYDQRAEWAKRKRRETAKDNKKKGGKRPRSTAGDHFVSDAAASGNALVQSSNEESVV